MHQAENARDQIFVVGILLKAKKVGVQLLQTFVGFGNKFCNQIVHKKGSSPGAGRKKIRVKRRGLRRHFRAYLKVPESG
jgi:hypothetical protein